MTPQAAFNLLTPNGTLQRSVSTKSTPGTEMFLQRCMNNTLVEISLHTFGYKRRSRELRPLLGMVSMIMPDDDAPGSGVLHIF